MGSGPPSSRRTSIHAFTPARGGGYRSQLTETERRVIARLVADVALLLGTPLSADDADVRSEPASDEEILAALDFDPADDPSGGRYEAAPSPEAPEDPALARLLPPASEDAELAAELRAMTESTLRGQKAERLARIWRTLHGAGSGAEDIDVRILAGTEGEWLAALTDIRLVLAARLGIEDEADVERWRNQTLEEDADQESEVTAAMATMYNALTWWQESLLQAVVRRGGRG